MDNASTTPMLRQYSEIKKKYPGTLLFFRLGDFYELFYEDAAVAARLLDITLTARHRESKNPVPMCGVPHHSAAGYIARLVKKGFRVAICEQTESPAQNNAKLFRREVVRVITPGTAVDAQLLASDESVYLAAVCGAGETFGAAFLELSTGEFFATEISDRDAWTKICSDIESFAPRELLFPESLRKLIENSFGDAGQSAASNASNVVSIAPPRAQNFSTALNALDDWLFQTEDAAVFLQKQFAVRDLKGFGIAGKHAAVASAAAVLRYARETQRTAAAHVSELNCFDSTGFLMLDAVTLKNLEIVESRGENSKRTLFGVIDRNVTGMGSRLLRSWLLRPSVRRSEIQTRLAAVEELTGSMLREKIRFLLKEVSDLERLVGRLNLGTITPRDLIALNRSLSKTPEINSALSDANSLLLQVLSENIFELPEIRSLIDRSVSIEPPVNFADGGTIRAGFDSDLDEVRHINQSAKQIVAGIEEQERRRTGINNLKIKFTNVFGYFIEISKGNLARVPENYERRQTLTNAERFTTPELKELEQKILGAEEKILELETEIFRQIRAEVQKETRNLQSTARALATLDALQSLAETAARRNYVAPQLHDGDEISIKNGRHPIIEAFSSEPFVPNDLIMNNSTDRLLIITGPNMGGKSTVLRQAAIIQILAQIGSFVPADAARLPVLDRIWTRVGASDDLASGRSTFMVEMTETAQILRHATPRSLVLLDEIGRGTSTFDGLSIAWAVAEYLHDSPAHSAKTLFATHYHELTELAEKLPGAKNYQITAAERDGEVVFLHKLAAGKASKSYGIAVAQLAGLPARAVARALEVLEKLERCELAVFSEENKFPENKSVSAAASDALETAARRSAKSRLASQVSLFALSNENIIDELRATDTANLTPDEAKLLLEDFHSRLI